MEELDIPALLRRLERLQLSPMERVLLAHTGTVQLLLSLYFGCVVDVKLRAQVEKEGELRREVSLVVQCTGEEVCFAASVIPLSANDPSVLADVRGAKLGLGQIAVKHRVFIERRIIEIAATASQISRKYVMRGPGLHYLVTEVFPRRLYR